MVNQDQSGRSPAPAAAPHPTAASATRTAAAFQIPDIIPFRLIDYPQNRLFNGRIVIDRLGIVKRTVKIVPLFLSFLAQSAEEALSELAADELGLHWTWLISTIGDLTLRTIDWGLVLLVFLLAYRFVPNTKTYWRYVWLGAAAATVMYQASLELFIWYLEHFVRYDTVYGPVSSVMVFLFWIYLSALILVLGAEISSEYERMHQSAEGDPANP